MGNYFVGVSFLLVLFVSWSAQSGAEIVSSTLASQERDRIARAVNECGYNLMLKMMKGNVNNNIAMSPTGVAGLLAMILLGSVGTTYDEIAKALGFSQDILENRKNHEQFGDLLRELNVNADVIQKAVTEASRTSNNIDHNDNNSSVCVDDQITRTLYADAIVVDEQTQIRDVYSEYLRRVYGGDALPTQFSDYQKSQQLINNWVQNHTNGKIVDFLNEPLPVTTKVVLLSALYFSGQWEIPFIQEYTSKMAFYRPSGKIMADLMLNAGDFNYTYKSQYGLHMLALPYNDSDTTMYVLKPYLSKKVTLLEVMEALNYSIIDDIINNMTMKQCIIRFPKMELKTKVNLKNSLRELGVNTMFSQDNANFALMIDNNNPVVPKKDKDIVTRILNGHEEANNSVKAIINNLPNPGLHVDTVLHDVMMSINEYGTVAVAATGGFLSRSATMFYADSPFYMFIRNERTKLVTFSAVIFDPTEA